MTGKSALELLKARLTHPHWFFGGRREGVPRRTLGAENVSAMSAMVLDIHRRRRRRHDVIKSRQITCPVV